MALRHLTDEQIQDFLDGNLSLTNKSAQKHLETCELCQEALEEYKKLHLELKKEPGFKLPKRFAADVISKLPQAPKLKSHKNYAEILLVILGILAGLSAILYFINWDPIVKTITYIPLLQFEFLFDLWISAGTILTNLKINIDLLLLSGLTLLVISILDYMVSHYRYRSISPFR
ncbi:MAG: hypothetical protein AMJ90_08085 [candidate division Zixibacteria bacterium SM23_73_2]|nr:MAG: hypothetical protein AMJ90_08085 [candidate division Zixibacteria bacterium SM23_73_2]